MFGHKFTFYVPGTNSRKVLDGGLQNRMSDRVQDDFATMFGGCTVTRASGVWMDHATGKLVAEPVILVESFTDDEGHGIHEGDVFALAEEVCNIMGQESVALEIDGVLHLVSAKLVEVEAARIAA